MGQLYSFSTIVLILIVTLHVRETTTRTADVKPNCVVNCKSFPSMCEHGGTCRVRYNCQSGKCTCDGIACGCPENYVGARCEKPKSNI